MENQNMSIIDGLFKAFAAGDIPAVLESKGLTRRMTGRIYQ